MYRTESRRATGRHSGNAQAAYRGYRDFETVGDLLVEFFDIAETRDQTRRTSMR